MMRDGRIEFDWADGTYSFRLAWGQLSELQEKCDAGPYIVLNRLHNGSWRIEDITNIVRLGLIGGGLQPSAALKLVRAYVEDRPPMENLIPAQVILSAALMGAPEENVGEGDAASQTESSSTNSQTES
ncbi:gene transfer agent family protein [Rhizobium skierniewicense]|uniref:gene transfer agent family protein n=1 Tax=Rhizobium skierniewicense TaxID=984260 RepID=UPI001FAC1D5B|nr:gene transfer agent family protein [Rhizobium skierniewicense]MCI9865811.1 gene transfer agent family protein [Rhizobium skierniewicense]